MQLARRTTIAQSGDTHVPTGRRKSTYSLVFMYSFTSNGIKFNIYYCACIAKGSAHRLGRTIFSSSIRYFLIINGSVAQYSHHWVDIFSSLINSIDHQQLVILSSLIISLMLPPHLCMLVFLLLSLGLGLGVRERSMLCCRDEGVDWTCVRLNIQPFVHVNQVGGRESSIFFPSRACTEGRPP